MTKLVAPEGLRWVSCSRDMSWSASMYRHLIRVGRGQLSTLCGCTANESDIWRGNSVKPECAACVHQARQPIVKSPVDALAADIRAVDGNHDLGAGALAEALIAKGWAK